MNLIKLPPFYVGQKVVAVTNHSQGKFKTGDEFTVLGVMGACCIDWLIDVGVPTDKEGKCHVCESTFENDGHHWFAHYCFAPKQQANFPLMTFKEIVKKEKEEVIIPN